MRRLFRGLCIVVIVVGILALGGLLFAMEARSIHCPAGQHARYIVWMRAWKCQ